MDDLDVEGLTMLGFGAWATGLDTGACCPLGGWKEEQDRWGGVKVICLV